MVSIILLITTIFSSIRWLIWRVASESLIRYMKDKGYMPPSAEESKAYCECVLKELVLHERK